MSYAHKSCDPDELTRRAIEGDPTLLSDLFDCFRDDVVRFLRARCGDPDDAEDAAQDAFLNAARYLDGFRGDAPIRSWLYKLAGSACTKMRRGVKRDRSRHVSLEDASAGALAAGAPDPESARRSLDEMLEARLQPIEAALGALAETDRAVLLLRDGQQMSAREVAQELGLTESAVKSRLHRARASMRGALEAP